MVTILSPDNATTSTGPDLPSLQTSLRAFLLIWPGIPLVFLPLLTLLYLLMVGQTSTREKKEPPKARASPFPTVLRPLSGSW